MTTPIISVAAAGPPGSPVSAFFIATGVAGATAASRYAGATTSGAPASGTFAVGDFVVDQTGKIWICTAAGTPGTWTPAGPTIPVAISQGGTGQITQQAAINALAGATTSGDFLRGNGSNVQMAAIQTSDLAGVADFAPTGLTGATAASRYAGATTSGAPVSGTFSVGDFVVDQTGKVWVCITAGTPGTWTATGQPWVFDITAAAYGAKGDGRVATDGAMSSSSNPTHLTCASAPFTNADVGKSIIVNGAGADSTSALVTTIASVSSSTVAVLTTGASTTVSGAVVLWSSDDTAAIQSAINAAATYAETHGYAKVYRPQPPGGVFYGVAGLPVTTGAANSQLVIPNPSAAIPTPTLEFYAEQGPSVINMWTQTVPQYQGALVSFGVFPDTTAAVNNYNASGPYAVLGSTPSETSLLPNVDDLPAFANINVVVRNWTSIGPATTNGLQYSAVNLGGCAKGYLDSCAALITANYSTGSGPNALPSVNSFGNAEARAFILPGNGNNDQAMGRNLTATGYACGVQCGEHAYLENPKIIGCCFAFQLSGSDGVPGEHLIKIIGASAEDCYFGFNVVNGGESGVGFFVDAEIDIEGLGAANTLMQDFNSGAGLATLFGQIRVYGAYSNYDIFPPAWPTSVKIYAVGGNGSPAPGYLASYAGFSGAGSNVAVQNPYWRDAQVIFSGGTISAVKAGVTLGGSGGTATAAPTMDTTGLSGSGSIVWPSGGWLSFTYTGSPTWNLQIPS